MNVFQWMIDNMQLIIFIYQYAPYLNETLFSTEKCGFDEIKYSMGREGVLHFDIESLNSDYAPCATAMMTFLASQPGILYMEGM
mmetsp:Transcript_17379/g.26069  ORF Transcript_17379/g.26069 Transcript_17379/m.26069 type:complete len:84 (+) Transcript_17379:412-663(+)